MGSGVGYQVGDHHSLYGLDRQTVVATLMLSYTSNAVNSAFLFLKRRRVEHLSSFQQHVRKIGSEGVCGVLRSFHVPGTMLVANILHLNPNAACQLG